MKKIVLFFILVLAVLVSSCGRNSGRKFEAFSPEAIAMNAPDGWEVNASVRVKGFDEEIQDKTHKAKLAYSVDLVTPQGKTLNSFAADTMKADQQEEFIDLGVEAQMELDSTFTTGRYKVIFNVKDLLSGREVKADKEFDVSK
ncbi:MAG: hypothetical protein HF314_17040 [Ignavibacteria bacterium]|jgi:hypothetical protein|nr:hypothetical protein [Ignavibacteria bacterium]MCU7504791.1 hypothetical protein [Ignavibacteria bacterium]MCU7517677.1 hypothetical protein [Ignavibacteria bacterium]